MRTFEERKAEIFRRSEMKIKERKRIRRYIAALCVPLCLTLAVLSVAVFPALYSGNDKNMSVAEGTNIENSVTENSGIYVKAEITSVGNSLKSVVVKEDKKEIERIYFALVSAFSSGNDKNNNGSSTEDNAVTEENSLQSSIARFSAVYKITFSTYEGIQKVYTLSDCVLTDNISGESVILSDIQCFYLSEELGLEIILEDENG